MTTAAPTKPETAVAVRDEPQLSTFQVIERVIAAGDLGAMKPAERVDFYWRTCESLGLNPLTRPFEFITLNGKLTMYARKDATDQLRKLNAVTVTGIRREKDAELGLVTVYATGRAGDGREDEASGVVNIKGLSGEALANALMKAETKAKRRLTLSLVGLGFLDESEVEGADKVDVDPATGVVTERAKPKSLLESVRAQQEALEAPSAPADPAPVATAEPVIEEGSFTEVVAEPATPAGNEPTLADTIRAAAAASDLEGRASQADVTDVLATTFKGWDRELVLDGIRAIFGDEAVNHPGAAQVAALRLVGDSLPVAQFLAGWRALIAEAVPA